MVAQLHLQLALFDHMRGVQKYDFIGERLDQNAIKFQIVQIIVDVISLQSKRDVNMCVLLFTIFHNLSSLVIR